MPQMRDLAGEIARKLREVGFQFMTQIISKPPGPGPDPPLLQKTPFFFFFFFILALRGKRLSRRSFFHTQQHKHHRMAAVNRAWHITDRNYFGNKRFLATQFFPIE